MNRRLLLSFLCAFCLVVMVGCGLTPAKIKVHTRDDLPRFTYAVQGTAVDLLKSDPATFQVFAAKVSSDLNAVLHDYDIEDRATLHDFLTVKLNLELLTPGQDQAALETVHRIRELEDKPDAKLISGLSVEAMLEARAEAGQTAGEAYQRFFARNYRASLEALPWSVVGNRVKELKMSAELISASMLEGSVVANIEPAVASSHSLSSDMAWNLIGARTELLTELPLKAQLYEVLNAYVNAHNVQKPDIWAVREVILDASRKLTPVRVAIWDSGIDTALFPEQLFTDPQPGDNDPHGLAYDMKNFHTHGELFPLTGEQQKKFPEEITYMQGFEDLRVSIDSPEATALKKHLSTLTPAAVSSFMEELSLYFAYSHGTHVAGIASRGNPAVRLVVARITYDYHNIPLAPSEELSRRWAADLQVCADYFRVHGIRVVNMSWGSSPREFENALEKNGLGKDAADRKAIAKKLFGIEREALYNAIGSAPDVLFICAAGNSDSDNAFDEFVPSSFKLPNVLAVGAVDQAGDEAAFTSYGETVVVHANGYDVESYLPGGVRMRMSGTSMASPNVVNLAAKLLALDPSLKPAEVISLIREGATASQDGRRHLIDPKRSVELLGQRTGKSAP
jgi:subtilisin family serine protease